MLLFSEGKSFDNAFLVYEPLSSDTILYYYCLHHTGLANDAKILVDNYPTYVLTTIPGELWDKDSIFKAITEYIDLDTRIIKTNYKKYYSGRFTPTRLAKDLTFSQISRLEENRLGLEGIYYEQVPERYFPTKVKASHILGYVKEVDRSIKSKLKNEKLVKSIRGPAGGYILEKNPKPF